MGMKTRLTMIAMTPRMMPARATPPLLASPLFARLRPMTPRISAMTPPRMPPTIVNDPSNAMMATTSAAIPRPFFGAVGAAW